MQKRGEKWTELILTNTLYCQTFSFFFLIIFYTLLEYILYNIFEYDWSTPTAKCVWKKFIDKILSNKTGERERANLAQSTANEFEDTT